MQEPDQLYMRRCLELAALGAGSVAPNPMVGAVLVYGNRIIGEGYHRQYGDAHAEVNCISSVGEEDKALISASTLYVSLEPCAHYGKTPPCSDLIIRHRIPRVVVGCRDPFAQVNGKGIEKLQQAGIEVMISALERECRELNRRFFCFVEKQRPYIIVKWAQTADGFMAGPAHERLLISHAYSNRLVHRWRSEESAILVGTQTALKDDPELTNRLWKGRSPVRMVIDKQLALPASLHLFDHSLETVVLNGVKDGTNGLIKYYRIDTQKDLVGELLAAAFALKLQSILVEGGAKLLQSFIDAGIWDEARVITNRDLLIGNGLPAPVLRDVLLQTSEQLQSDVIAYYTPVNTFS